MYVKKVITGSFQLFALANHHMTSSVITDLDRHHSLYHMWQCLTFSSRFVLSSRGSQLTVRNISLNVQLHIINTSSRGASRH